MIQFIDLTLQLERLRPQIEEAIARVLSHGKYILGPEVYELEERLAQYTGAKFCITCANGTDALQIAYMALGVGAGDEIITPAFSYIAAAEMAVVCGARPVYVDIRPDTFNLDADLVEAVITPRTRAIVPVSLFGQCADMTAINETAARYGIPVIEDAAQSFGATYKGTKSCNVSTIATTSFFPAKPLGCYGDGGAIFTDDETLASSMRQIARHGQLNRYRHDLVGINSRLDTIQAAVLLEKMKIFDAELLARREVASTYTRLLREKQRGVSGIEHIRPPFIDTWSESAWAQYTLRLPNRDAIQASLLQRGIPSNIYYPIPLNRQNSVADEQVVVPQSENACVTALSLPMHPYLKMDAQERIIEALVDACYQVAS